MKKPATITFAVIVIFVILTSFIAYYFRRHPTIELARIAIFGDWMLKEHLDIYKSKFIPKKTVSLETLQGEDIIIPTWAFRPSHAFPIYPIPVTGDVDHDGIPEVYIAGSSREVYALDGKTGNSLWEWRLPFGVIGSRVVELGDLDSDGAEEIIVGSSISLPARVYALKGGVQRSEERLLWARNLSGDFLEGGLSFVNDPSTGSPLIVAATRDGQASSGTLNIIKADGSFLFQPALGIDDCLSRPAIGNIPASSEISLIHGSHKFLGVTYGNRIVARDLRTGKIHWVSSEIGDTGWQNHQIVDVDFDSRNEVIAFAGVQNAKNNHNFILDGATGAIIREVPWKFMGVIKESKCLLVSQNNETSCLRPDGTVVYKIPNISFGIESEETSGILLFNITFNDNRLLIKCYRAIDGSLIKEYSSNLELPKYDNPADYGIWGEPSMGMSFCTLADTDNDGQWDMLIQVGDFIVNVKLPFKVLKGVNPSSPIPFGNIDNGGILRIQKAHL